jgi:hypothetical protein
MYPDFNWREATMTKGYIPTVIAFALQVRMHFAAEMYLCRGASRRHQENQTNQRSPKGTCDRTGSRGIDQIDLA